MIKVKHIFGLIFILFIIYINYKCINTIFFINTKEENNKSGWPSLLLVEIIILLLALVAYLPDYWNKTIINLKKFK